MRASSYQPHRPAIRFVLRERSSRAHSNVPQKNWPQRTHHLCVATGDAQTWSLLAWQNKIILHNKELNWVKNVKIE
jgi:hypothetical protein